MLSPFPSHLSSLIERDEIMLIFASYYAWYLPLDRKGIGGIFLLFPPSFSLPSLASS